MDLGYCSQAWINSRMFRTSNTLRWLAAAANPFLARITRRAISSSFGMKSLGDCTKIAAHPAAYVRRPLLYGVALALSISSAGAMSDPQIPDPTLTPGSWHQPPTPLVTLCEVHYTQQPGVRRVSRSIKAEVFRRYGYDPRSINWGDFEVDHLVALELDGDNSVENLWPQSYHSEPLNAHRKDVLEHVLHRLVCDRQLDLATAQQAIATDWVAAYKHYVLK